MAICQICHGPVCYDEWDVPNPPDVAICHFCAEDRQPEEPEEEPEDEEE